MAIHTDAVARGKKVIAASLTAVFIVSGCAGSKPIVLDPDRLPSDALLQRRATVEAIMLDGTARSGTFVGASDSLLLLEANRVAYAVPLDSVAYVNYNFPLSNTAKHRRLGFLRGLAFGVVDAAILTLIYSSADNDVNKSNLFWATAITSAVPLTIYFTLESGNKGKELDQKEITKFTSDLLKLPLRRRQSGRRAEPAVPSVDTTSVPDSLMIPTEIPPAKPVPPDTGSATPDLQKP